MGHSITQTLMHIFVYFLMFCKIFETGNASGLQPFFTVRVENDINIDNAPPLRVHCASKDDDLGYHTLGRSVYIHWEFRENFFWSTLFFCHFWWGQKQRAFEVFNSNWHEFCDDPNGRHENNLCFWLVRPDGFYFNNSLINPRFERKFTWE